MSTTADIKKLIKLMLKTMNKNYGLKKFDKEWNRILDKDKFVTLEDM